MTIAHRLQPAYRLPAEPAFEELPLGSILPSGWLKDQLVIQSKGFTGRLPRHWDHLGPDSGWLGGPGERWERGPYYIDGLLPLAYLLQDEALMAEAHPWIEWTLRSQQPDGQFGPADEEDWWPRMVMVKALIQYAEATEDERVVPFLLNYFRYQSAHIEERPLRDWGKARGGEAILSLQWLYRRTGERFLLELAATIHAQTEDWTGLFTDFPYWRYQTKFDHRIHVVNVAMGLKEPALYFLMSNREEHRAASRKGIEALMRYHGQLHGMFSGDEWLAGTHPSQGVELCAVVEYMYTLEHLVRIFGDGWYGDILERVAYNALPATISADWTSHQYVQQVNQIKCTKEHRNWTENRDDANMFGLEPNFGCCTANMHQGWPKFAARLWMGAPDGGVALIAYAPCAVNTEVAGGVDATFEVRTEYPFRDAVEIEVRPSRACRFPLKLRMPAWCGRPQVRVNGADVALDIVSGFATVEREWAPGDRVTVSLPMEVALEKRANDAVGVTRGPLVYALPLPERWSRRSGNLPFADWEIVPAPGAAWNYGLTAGGKSGAFAVEEAEVREQPYLAEQAPVRLKARAKRVAQWREELNSAGELPPSPVASTEAEEEIVLVPYASAKLRIAEFPVTKE
ncbi:beta-L-arabinofuranosidase domain-containing protein [Paenibacillus sp.]|uniref:beta-L-arabinofuranosidase domain-containing protein n=1 Tax=Paenibacillus sp. TaxID=58172 RepID=UPI00281219BD|nr:beta-L-arabinofuranosidase domain-containing protein [Paenibacillus sp.]